jgi:hypothetical protein
MNMNIIKPENFDISKFELVKGEEKSNAPQYVWFPKHKKNNVYILTNKIKITNKAISVGDGYHQVNDDACLKFNLYLNDVGGLELKTKVYNVIDKHFGVQLKNNAQNKLILDKWGEPIKKLDYTNCDNSIIYDDDNEIHYGNACKIKLKICTKIDKETGIKKISTQVYMPIDINKPIDDREFSEPINIKCLDDVRQHYHTDCTVRFLLNINKFWVQKNTGPDGKHMCGFTTECVKMFILDDPLWFKWDQKKPIIGFGIKIASNLLQNNNAETTEENDSDDDNEDDIEELNSDDEIYNIDEPISWKNKYKVNL